MVYPLPIRVTADPVYLVFFLSPIFFWFVDFRLMLVADCIYTVTIFRETVFTDEHAKIV